MNSRTIRRPSWFLVPAAALLLGAALAGCSASTSNPSSTGGAAPQPGTQGAQGTSATAASLPTPDHVVVVIFENKEAKEVADNTSAPYFNQLAAKGATFSDWTAITHPSQPNYLALFSGSTQGVAGDSCQTANKLAGPDLGGELIAAGKTFTSYSESMPSDGFTGCTSGQYAMKHNAAADFADVPATSNLTFVSFPQDFTKLPTVAFVDPNLCNDMHSCSVATGDAWLKARMSAYADWATVHNSLLVVMFDEDDFTGANVIPATIVGAGVKPGVYGAHVDHYSLLRTLEDMYHLPYAGASAKAADMQGMWTSGS